LSSLKTNASKQNHNHTFYFITTNQLIMKKYYMLFTLLSGALFHLQAQITITRSDFGSVGDVLYYGNDTTVSNLSVGASGANKTWDFSKTVDANYYDTSVFVDPSTIAGAPAEANLALDGGEDGNETFFNINNNRVKTILPLGAFLLGNQQLTITNFPLNFGDDIKDSAFIKTQGKPDDLGYTNTPFDSIRIRVVIKSTSKADGWGSIITPVATHSALRVRSVVNTDFTIEGKLPFIGWSPLPINPDGQQVLYAWYGKGKNFSLAEASLDTNGVIKSFRYQVDSIPRKPTTGLVNINRITPSISAYPNPANEKLVFDFTNVEGELEIFTITGQVISKQPISGPKVSVETQYLPAGIYFVKAKNKYGAATTLKFVVQH
jgi:hypothetical protein